MYHRLTLATALFLAAVPASADEWRVLLVGEAQATGDVSIAFAPDGSIFGSTGCNRFLGQATFDGEAIVFATPILMTRMACPETEITQQENAIVDLLQDRVAVTLNPFTGEMVLSRGNLSLIAAPGVK